MSDPRSHLRALPSRSSDNPTSHAPVVVVLGGQFGSEGKGQIVAHLARTLSPGAVVRTGGPNAGHTLSLLNPNGSRSDFPMRTIPCAWHLPNVQLYLGPGSIIDPDVLISDMDLIVSSGLFTTKDIGHRLHIDSQSTILSPAHKDQEASLFLHQRLGSTGKGIGAARSDRVLRKAFIIGNLQVPLPVPYGVCDASYDLNTIIDAGASVIVESTQGFGLSLHASGHYPYITSADLTPGHLLGDAGLSSRIPHYVVAVLRTFPIRVAGNSGPMRGETSWEELHKQNPLIPHDGERTTVTHKVRRVSHFDVEEVDHMARVCRPDAIALTFLDYIDPTVSQAISWLGISSSKAVISFIDMVEESANAPVKWVSVGPGRIFETDR